LRSFLQHQAGLGVTVLVSSHVLSEVQQTVDNVIIIRSGSLVYQGSLASLTDGGPLEVVVRGPHIERLKEVPGWNTRAGETGSLIITGVSAAEIGHRAFTESVELHELREKTPDLEAMFLGLTQSEGIES
jgi:ABC-2 type transport system ATP-binding protein